MKLLTKELCDQHITVSMAQARRLICNGNILVNGEKPDVNTTVNTTDEIKVVCNDL